MIIVSVKQNTPEWLAARAGIPTASCFDKILSPKTLKLSASADKYMYRLIAERMLGYPLESASSDFMSRGHAMEPQAVDYYELQRGVDTEPVGFVLTDDRRAGCSPDRLVGADGMLQIKSPGPEAHIGYLLVGVADEHRIQVQGEMWVCERQWSDVLSYHPDLPPALARVERDDDYITALSKAVTEFCSRLEEAYARLAAPTRPVEIAGATSGHEGPSCPNDGGFTCS